jgi:hypothetical protein
MRKFWLGIGFMCVGGVLGWKGIDTGSDLVGLSTIIGAIAGGLFGVVWGNAQEHRANGKKDA